MDLTALVRLVLGLIVLTIGAELLIRGASRLAATARVPPLVIGLTVVAFGTSAPELAVSLKAALVGQPDIAIGNVVGSNICNVLLILGLSATVAPLVVSAQLVRLGHWVDGTFACSLGKPHADLAIRNRVGWHYIAIADQDPRTSWPTRASRPRLRLGPATTCCWRCRVSSAPTSSSSRAATSRRP